MRPQSQCILSDAISVHNAADRHNERQRSRHYRNRKLVHFDDLAVDTHVGRLGKLKIHRSSPSIVDNALAYLGFEMGSLLVCAHKPKEGAALDLIDEADVKQSVIKPRPRR